MVSLDIYVSWMIRHKGKLILRGSKQQGVKKIYAFKHLSPSERDRKSDLSNRKITKKNTTMNKDELKELLFL